MSRVRKPGPAPHTCCYCSKTHARGAASFDVAGTRCVKREGCIYKPLPKVAPVKPRHVCFVCHGAVPAKLAKCTNRGACQKRALSTMRALRYDDATISIWYRQAIHAPEWQEARELAAAA